MVDTSLVRPSPTFWAPFFVPHTLTAGLLHTLKVFAPIWSTTTKSRFASRPEWKAQSFSTLPFLCSKVFSHPTQRTRSFLPTKPLLLRLWVDINMFQVSYEFCFTCTITHLLLCICSWNCGTWQRSLFGRLDQLPCKTKTIFWFDFQCLIEWITFNLGVRETHQSLLRICWFQGQSSWSWTFLQIRKGLCLWSPNYFGEHG